MLFGRGFDSPHLHQTSIGRTPIFSAADLPLDVFSDTKTKNRNFRLKTKVAVFRYKSFSINS